MSNERNIEILEHKIAELERKISLHTEQDISQKKLNNLLILKIKYEIQLEEIQHT